MLVLLSATAEAGFDSAGSVNVAEFGTAWSLQTDKAQPVYAPAISDGKPDTSIDVSAGQVLQIVWRQPRDVAAIAVRGPSLPSPGDIEVQYWHAKWPDNGTGGWMELDDPYNGNWVTVKADALASSDVITFTFAPLGKEEIPGVEKTGFLYRRTYKVRLTFKSAANVSEMAAYTGAEWKTAEIKLEWKCSAKKLTPWTGKIEGRNARALAIRGDANQAVVKVQYSDAADRLSEDRGYVIFRAPGWNSFSVFVDDVVREGGIYVRDIDAFVSDTSKKLTYAKWKKPADAWDGTVMTQVSRLPEQTLGRAMSTMPALPPREAYIGVPNQRMEFCLSASGNIELDKRTVRCPGRDVERCPWGKFLGYVFSSGEKPAFTPTGGRETVRHLEGGYLPVIATEWKTVDVQYKQAAFVTMLVGGIGDKEDSRRGDEPVLLLSRTNMTNTSSVEQTAYLWMEMSVKAPMTITSDGTLLLDKPTDGEIRAGLTPVRGKFDVHGRGELSVLPDYVPDTPGSPDSGIGETAKPRQVVRYSVKLAPGESHTIEFNVPAVELLDNAEMAALAASKYDERHREVVDYWEKRFASGMDYEVPDPVLNNLFKANLWHVLITTDKDPETSLLQHYAGTVKYVNYANEACMVARSLEMRGEHKEARSILEPFLASQSTQVFPGNFKSKDGVFHAAFPYPDRDPYTALGYNMNHGWVLWGLAEHYKWTGDATDLQKMAPSLVKACDWITRERQATKVLNPDGTKPVEWGLAPAGQLEDVSEFLYYYSTNAYYYVGMRTAVEALARIQHPQASRIHKDAEAYKADILASIREATATAPVVKLRDGTWAPYVPPRAYVNTHLKEGWIREGLYPALHLLDGEVFKQGDLPVTWLLEDLEDNIFLSKESGYPVVDMKAEFFDFGGFNKQPNLLANCVANLRRDEVPQFLRVLFNTCAASYYRDTVCFAEWVRKFGQGGGPVYKTPDETKFCNYLRNMLVFEEGDTLKLAMGVPGEWMTDGKTVRIARAATFFGPMDMKITSHAAQGFVTASLSLPARNPAAHTLLRLRHPDGKKMRKVTVNGKPWKQFSPAKNLITLPADVKSAEVVAYF